ncbi:protein argonaute-2 [Favolaschia claudopus]|uniref:Protein argonaute-2 n=1 Tax=Favolaschia claudopus TaxID=2862362 RepID=A0AAW0CSF0_9AGAR
MPPRSQNRPGPRGGGQGPRQAPAARGPQQPVNPPGEYEWRVLRLRLFIEVDTAQHITTVGVRRPGYGSSGRPIPVYVNSFTVEIPDSTIYHYDVIANDKVLPSAMNQRLIKALQDNIAPGIFAETRCVFDGRKNLYAPVELNLGGDSREFDVSLPGAPASSDRPPRIYKIRLTRVATINTEILHRFIQGQQSHDNTVSTALMAFNVAIRQSPSERFPTKGRSFFTEEGSKAIGAGLVLWRGYFQSIRPAVGRMLINVDISTGVMYQSGPLISLCLSYLNLPGNNPLALTSRLDNRMRLKLSRFIAGIRVDTRDPRRPNAPGSRPPRVVRKLSQEGASEVTFMMRDGRSMTVARYFEETTGTALRFPTLLCAEVGQGALIPLELCFVLRGQLVRKEIPDEKKADLVAFATKKPKERLESITKGMDILAYGQSEYVRKFGLTVTPQVVSTQARVLNPPTLKYGQGSKAPNVQPRNGSWNMADKKFFRPSKIATWVLIVLDGRVNDNLLADVSRGFVEGCVLSGMTVTNRDPIVKRINGQSKIPPQLQAAGADCFAKYKLPPTLFVVILPEGGNDLYTIVKHWGDVDKGVATQCLKSRNCTRANLQFWANIALKVNVKLGGTNVVTDPTSSTILSDPRTPTIIMGADVMHPGAGTHGRPSYAAVVSSVDSYAAKYVAVHRVQASRQELISDLSEMTKYLLEKYMAYRTAIEEVPANLKAPKRLIFYRDGVSEGQFQQVLDLGSFSLPSMFQAERGVTTNRTSPHQRLTSLLEIMTITDNVLAACEELKINLKITLVVVGKRHHVRLFPQNDRDADRSGNCPAGTVVDRDIGHPTEFDFYLQSHAGLLGTSRPGHYSENNLTADTMQALSFALCHVYAGSTRSVSIPAPVYYADSVCARAKIHFDPEKTVGDFSDSGVTDTSDTLEAFKRDFKALHPNQMGRQYFSLTLLCLEMLSVY